MSSGMTGMLKEMLALPLQAAHPSKGRCTTPRESKKKLTPSWQILCRSLACMLHQSWTCGKSMTGFMTGTATSWLVGRSWLIYDGGVGCKINHFVQKYFGKNLQNSSWFVFSNITFQDYFATILKHNLEKKIKIIVQDSCQNICEQNHLFYDLVIGGRSAPPYK